MPDKPSTAASDFIGSIFGPGSGSESPVFVCALPNERGDHAERKLLTRDRASIDGFVAKWDRKGSAIYFCTGTLRADAEPDKPGGSIRLKSNVAEIVSLFGDTDLKSVDLDRDGIVSALLGLFMPPSVIVWSGRGAQPYWLLNEALEATPKNIERVEALNAQIADVIAGDAIRDVSRLLRLPGSHNTKDGGWRPVEVVHARLEPRYSIDDLEEWLSWAAPAIKRKDVPARAGGSGREVRNAFERVAAEYGFRVPVDAEARLAAMSYQAAGDASVHATQLSVSASMLARGEPIDIVTETLLAATRAAAGDAGRNWNWGREERAIQKMCDDWVRKHPEVVVRIDSQKTDSRQKAQARQSDRGDSLSGSAETIREGSTGATVHRISDERERRQKKPKQKKADGDVAIHIMLGDAVLEAMRERGEAVIFMRKAAWIYSNGLWSMEVDGLRGWLDVQIETACRALNLESTNRTVGEARQWIQRNPDLWREAVEWDRHGKIPTRSGLIDPLTGTVETARPEHYCTWRVDADYEPAAACHWWEVMIGDTFADRGAAVRAETVGTLQEILGCALIDVKPRALSKALCLVGGSNYGKSGVLEVFSGLFGDDAITSGLESLEGTHGTMAFVKRVPWVLHEAFDQSKWHFSSMVKAIITGEPVPINVKQGPLLTQRIRSPIFWGTNHPPQFREATRAIVNRLVIIECRREFREGAYVGAAVEARRRGLDRASTLILAAERSGLLNWALAGLRRALERGSIHVTEEMTASADEIHRDSNLAAGFIEECCEFDRDMRVAVPDFCAAFAVWWLENKGEDRRIPSNEAIGKAVTALADRRIASNPKELRDKTRRYYGGLVLNDQGRALWKRAAEAKAFEGKTASTTPTDEPVNTYIPEGWFVRPSVFAMRVAQVSGGAVTGDDFDPSSNCHPVGTVTSKTVTAELSSILSSRDLSPEQVVDSSRKPQF